jgi:thiamine pyrophosphokinase
MNNRVVIISNGKVMKKDFFLKFFSKSDFIIAVDGGSKHAKSFGLIPDLIIGDLDSINQRDYLYFLKKGSKFKKYDADKDKTDLHLAIDYAIKSGFKEILLLCIFGERIDHLIANIFLLIKTVDYAVDIKIIDEFHEIFLIKDYLKINGRIGDVVSLIPLTPVVTGIELSGLKFIPKDGKLRMSDTLGISNILTQKEASIKIKKGKLLVIKPRFY